MSDATMAPLTDAATRNLFTEAESDSGESRNAIIRARLDKLARSLESELAKVKQEHDEWRACAERLAEHLGLTYRFIVSPESQPAVVGLVSITDALSAFEWLKAKSP